MRVALGALAVLTVACDYGPREQRTALGPPLHIVATYPEDGAGIDCPSSEPVCGVPIDAPLELRFDRFLLPTTAVRQSIAYYTGRSRNAVVLDPDLPELTPTYDPVERVVRFLLPEGASLVPNTLYTVEFPVAGKPATPARDVVFVSWGFRAFDGAPLDEQGILRISFRTGEHRSATPPVAPPTCDDVARELRCEGESECQPAHAGCASAGCHLNGALAPLGLALASRDGLRDAIGRVAHQTETGPTTGVPLEAPERFGSGMPVIDPFRPENSYLLYKLLVAPTAYLPSRAPLDACPTDYLVAAPSGPDCLVPPVAEIDRLRAYFVLGDPMPPPDVPSELAFFHRAEVRKLTSFIRAGAVCP